MATGRGQDLLAYVEFDSAQAVARAVLAYTQEDDDAESERALIAASLGVAITALLDLDAIVDQVLDGAPS